MITISEWSLSIINGQKIIESSLILDGQPVGVVRTKTLMCLCVDECVAPGTEGSMMCPSWLTSIIVSVQLCRAELRYQDLG